MLVTRHFEPEQIHWSNKFEAAFHKPTSPRMSGYDSSLSTQPDWQGHYSYLPPGDSSIYGQSFEQVSSSSNNNGIASQHRSSGPQTSHLGSHGQTSSGSLGSPRNRRALDPLGLRQPKSDSTTHQPPGVPGDSYTIKTENPHEEPTTSAEATHIALTRTPPVSLPSTEQRHNTGVSAGSNEKTILSKEEDETVDDDDMIHGDGDCGCEGEEHPSQPQTAAERTAARRKMKRFRLTHQQTRFLMSEFAKQPHPDAAHRERLSREIPGLSPRQVQVWFQNRRAKIKRMTADDRDRMIKMRAVPDDFDNVQALHSPYGAVHPLGTPITPPVDFGSSSYTDHIIRPLLVDTMRRDGDDHISPTGISPAFGNIGFTPSGTMSSSDMISPLSPSSNDRGYYSSHLTSPLSGSSRANLFARQNSLDSGVQSLTQSRQHIRPLQPLSLRETISKPRTDSLQSPLRTSMSWKDGSIGYATYSGSGGSSGAPTRQGSTYQADPIGSNAGGPLGYDTSSYSTSSLRSSAANINYSSLQRPSQNRARLRAASATLPLGLDLRHQYRPFSSNHSLQPLSHASTPRTTSTVPYSSSGYSTSFPVAPLAAPIDYSLSRTPSMRNSIQEYSVPHMNAPIAPPHEYNQALHGSMPGSSSRTPIRDTFGGGHLAIEQGHEPSNEKSGGYSPDSLSRLGAGGLKRKRSLPQEPHTTSPSQSSQSYGHTN
ncbi:hypothetical protein GGR50DRAFT_299820 [Xylaria sp. CBS 124048]|nr:hypothetical protein GGR50DRAFT_299820 [Xylaria sp. CBS 124048]